MSIFSTLRQQGEHVFWQQHVHFFCLRSLAGVREPEAFADFLKKDCRERCFGLSCPRLTAAGGQKRTTHGTQSMWTGKEMRLPTCGREEERVGFGACWKGNFEGHTLFLAGTSVSLLTSGTREGSRTQGYMFWVLPTIPNLNCFHVGTLEKLENLPPITAETFLEESWGRVGPCAGKERCCSRLFPAVHPLYVFLIMAFQLLAFQLVRISH